MEDQNFECQRCESKDLLLVAGKLADTCYISMDVEGQTLEYEGQPPENLNIGFSAIKDNYLQFQLCTACGQVQGTFSIKEEALAVLTKAKKDK